MGAEVLEEDEFEPMFASCESKLSGKRIALFGSYEMCIRDRTMGQQTVLWRFCENMKKRIKELLY